MNKFTIGKDDNPTTGEYCSRCGKEFMFNDTQHCYDINQRGDYEMVCDECDNKEDI